MRVHIRFASTCNIFRVREVIVRMSYLLSQKFYDPTRHEDNRFAVRGMAKKLVEKLVSAAREKSTKVCSSRSTPNLMPSRRNQSYRARGTTCPIILLWEKRPLLGLSVAKIWRPVSLPLAAKTPHTNENLFVSTPPSRHIDDICFRKAK